MKDFYIIAVGKLKNKELEIIEEDFLKRISNPNLKIIETKAYSEDCELEANDVIKKINELASNENFLLYTLEENGKEYDSRGFAEWTTKLLNHEAKKIFFVLGGASGHGGAVLARKNGAISLSKLTFPHKLARILLVEQLYRAQTIRQKHPYHK
jgi:23S rRNA (pseudouridine1915-N3)-methyltransferase